MSPRLVKTPTNPQTLEDTLADLLSSRDQPGTVTGPPSTVETAGEGPLKQSGTFPATVDQEPVRLGQPGGYTSGRPPVTEQRYDEVFGSADKAGTGTPTPRRPPSTFGGRGGEAPPDVPSPASAVTTPPAAAVDPTPVSPEAPTEDLAAALARMLGTPSDDVMNATLDIRNQTGRFPGDPMGEVLRQIIEGGKKP